MNEALALGTNYKEGVKNSIHKIKNILLQYFKTSKLTQNSKMKKISRF